MGRKHRQGWWIVPPPIAAKEDWPNSKKILFGVLNGIADEESRCRPSDEYLAEQVGKSERTVRRYLKELDDACFINREGRKDTDEPWNRVITVSIAGATDGRSPHPPPATDGRGATSFCEDVDKGSSSSSFVDSYESTHSEDSSPRAQGAPDPGVLERGERDDGKQPGSPDWLVAEWIDEQPSRPSGKEISRQAGVADRICSGQPRDRVVLARLGIGNLYPHSDGEPWDLFDLERKFSKAVAAADLDSNEATLNDSNGDDLTPRERFRIEAERARPDRPEEAEEIFQERWHRHMESLRRKLETAGAELLTEKHLNQLQEHYGYSDEEIIEFLEPRKERHRTHYGSRDEPLWGEWWQPEWGEW